LIAKPASDRSLVRLANHHWHFRSVAYLAEVIDEIVTRSLLDVGSLAFANDGWQADLARTQVGRREAELLHKEASAAYYFTLDPPPTIARFHLP